MSISSLSQERIVDRLFRSRIPPQIAEVFNRGTRVPVDKDGMVARFLTQISPAEPMLAGPPSEQEFPEVIYDLLSHVVRTAKKL
jgi:hypothetical protein